MEDTKVAVEVTTPASAVETPKADNGAAKRTRSRKPRNKTPAASTDDVPATQGADREKRTRSRRTRVNSNADEQVNTRQTREFKNVFGDAIIEPEQIRDTCIEKAESTFLEPEVLLSKLQGRSNLTKHVRVHERACELDERYAILDFSLRSKTRHSKEIDNSYYLARNDPSIWNNVRDGNTLLIEYLEENKVENVTFLRQGLPKFFSLTSDAVSEQRRSSLPRDAEQAYYQYDTLAQVKKALMQGSKVEVHRSLKTNGDGAHVTWSTELNSWVITSQNVSIVARNEKEIKSLYPEQTRYFLARKIALCWMRKIKQIDNMGQGRLENLKSDLTQNVFIGDFIGNNDLVNLIKYSRETISFHHVVRKDRSTATAQNSAYCEVNSFNILKRHPIDVTPNIVCGIYETYDELCSSLSEIHKQVANSSLCASEEGAVLTFIRRQPEGSSQADSVISMCKVKSVEYQALRLMIDTIQSAVDAGDLERAQDTVFTKFVKEFKTFSRNIDESMGSHPETFFIDLFSTAFNMVAKRSLKDKEMYQDLLFNDTAKFMVLVLKNNEEKNQGRRYVGQIDLISQNLGESAKAKVTFEEPSQSKPAAKKSNVEVPSDAKPDDSIKKSLPAQAAATTTKEDKAPKRRERKTEKAAPANQPAAAAVQQEEVAAKPAKRVPTSMPDVTALVVPPFALTKSLMESIKETYKVIESKTLDVSEIEETLKRNGSKGHKSLVILSSLDNITEESRLCKLRLFAYKCQNEFKGEPAENFYLDSDRFYAHSNFKNVNTAKSVRTEVEKMIKVANSSNLIKLLNPARMHLRSEEELMVVLKLQEPASVDVSVEEQKPQVVEEEAPKPKAEKPSKKSNKKVQETKPAPKTKPAPAKVTLSEPVTESPEKKNSQIVVVFPIGIPGMGKTHFAENTLKDVFGILDLDTKKNLHIIQNDLVRKACLDKYLKENPKKSVNDGVKATAQKSINMFKDQLNSNLLNLSKNSTKDVQMIYLDKNYPPAEIKITLEAIKSHEANQNAKIRCVALVPQIASNNYLKDYPFSTTFLVQCYIRCLEREGHLTMSNDDPDRLAKILVLFFQQFKGTKFNRAFMEELGFENIIKVCFTMEHEDLELPPKLEKALRQAVNQSDLGGDNHIVQVCRLIDLYRGLFSGSYSSPQNDENTNMLKESLDCFTSEFKQELVLAEQQAQAASQQKQVQLDEAIVEEVQEDEQEEEQEEEEESEEEQEDDQEVSEDSFEVVEDKNTPAPEKVAKRVTIDFQAEFKTIQQQGSSQQGAAIKKKTLVKQATPYPTEMKTFVPKVQSNPQPAAREGFETYGEQKRKRRNSSDDSESEETRIPHSLLLKIKANRQDLSDSLAEALQKIPKQQMNSALVDDVAAINEVLSSQRKTVGGWSHPTELQMTCMQVNRDQDAYEDSQLARNFESDKSVRVSCSAILLVPGKAVIGIASLNDQDVEEKVPHVALLNNDFKQKAMISDFVRSACQTRGPFAGTIKTLQTGGKVPENKSFQKGNVSMGRDVQPVTSYLITLNEPIEIVGKTHIQY